MPTRVHAIAVDLQSDGLQEWSVYHSRGYRAHIIVWGLRKDLSTLEIRSKFDDLGLGRLVRGAVGWEGDHVRLILLPKDSREVSAGVIREISSCLRKIGCRCVLDESVKRDVMPLQLKYSNRFTGLQSCVEDMEGLEEDTEECREVSRESVVNVTDVHSKVRVAEREARKVRVATWNFSGICSQRKQKEVAGVLKKNNVDICAGQESWEKEESKIYVDGYKWLGKVLRRVGGERGE